MSFASAIWCSYLVGLSHYHGDQLASGQMAGMSFSSTKNLLTIGENMKFSCHEIWRRRTRDCVMDYKWVENQFINVNADARSG